MRDSEKEYPPLSRWECHSEQDVTRQAQVSDDGWAADRPMGGLGTPRQKWLRGKIVKTRHGRQYKKGINHAQKRGRTEQESKR